MKGREILVFFVNIVTKITIHLFWIPGTILRRDVGEASEPFRVSSRASPTR